MEQRGNEQGFPPIWTPGAKALILGSYPSPKSFEAGFYYGHPQNRFWPMLAALAGKPIPKTIPDKTTLILNSDLALWDSLAQCRITGASDSSIADPVPNDIASLMAKTNITAIFCNGGASYRFYTRFCEKQTGIPAFKMPSTSPANAAYTLPKLLDAWAPLQKFML